MYNLNKFAARFQEESRRYGDTPAKIAGKLNVPLTAVIRWSRGKVYPSGYYLICLYQAGMDIVYLLTGERTRGGDTHV